MALRSEKNVWILQVIHSTNHFASFPLFNFHLIFFSQPFTHNSRPVFNIYGAKIRERIIINKFKFEDIAAFVLNRVSSADIFQALKSVPLTSTTVMSTTQRTSTRKTTSLTTTSTPPPSTTSSPEPTSTPSTDDDDDNVLGSTSTHVIISLVIVVLIVGFLFLGVKKCHRDDPHDENYETFIMDSIIESPIIIDAIDAFQPGSSIMAQISVNDKRQMMTPTRFMPATSTPPHICMPSTSSAAILVQSNPINPMHVIEIPTDSKICDFSISSNTNKSQNTVIPSPWTPLSTFKPIKHAASQSDEFETISLDRFDDGGSDNCSFSSLASTVVSCDLNVVEIDAADEKSKISSTIDLVERSDGEKKHVKKFDSQNETFSSSSQPQFKSSYFRSLST